ncbi:MAG: beta-galactosidase trimerization domain-containing protein, partial [Agathobacter rectalis]
SKGGCEKFHGAVIAHVGTNDTRVFRETAQLGRELESFGTRTLGTRNKSDVGIIFDWDNYWALEYTSGPTQDLKYVDQIHHYYGNFTTKISQSMIRLTVIFQNIGDCRTCSVHGKEGMKEKRQFVKNGSHHNIYEWYCGPV